MNAAYVNKLVDKKITELLIENSPVLNDKITEIISNILAQSKISGIEIDANKNMLGKIFDNFGQIIVNDVAGEKTEKLSLKSGNDPDDAIAEFVIYDSDGNKISMIKSTGAQYWLLHDGNGVVRGGIQYTTPAAIPGIAISRQSTNDIEDYPDKWNLLNGDNDFTIGRNDEQYNGRAGFAVMSGENMRLGNVSLQANREHVFVQEVSSVPPSAGRSNACQLYVKDVASSAEFYVRDESGTETVISPHAFEDGLIERSTPLDWCYRSENPHVGKGIAINIMDLAKEVESLSGKELLKIYDLPAEQIIDWDSNQELIRIENEQKIIEATQNKNDAIEIKDTLEELKSNEEDLEIKENIQNKIDKANKIISEIIIPEAYIKKSKPSWIDLPVTSNVVLDTGK